MSEKPIYHVTACMPFKEVTEWGEKYGWIPVYKDKKHQKKYLKWLKQQVSN